MKRFSKIYPLTFFVLFLSVFITHNIYPQLVNDFRVNDDTTNQSQYSAKSGVDGQGNFVLTWTDNRNGRSNVYCQRFNSLGGFLGSNFKVNINPDTSLLPDIAVAKNGKFAVCWLDVNNNLTIVTKVKCRIFSKIGTPLTDEIIINDSLGQINVGPSICVNITNEFFITWSQKDILFQKIDSDGNKIGSNQKVNDDSGNYTHKNPDITVRNDGSFIIVWNDTRPPGMDNADDIYMQIYDKLGNKVGVNQMVNDDLVNTNQQIAPKISSDSTGNFVIAWSDNRLDNSHGEVFAQRYNNSGIKTGQNFRVTNSSLQFGKGVAGINMKPNGDFIIGWSEFRPNIPQCYFQRYSQNGNQIGNNYLVSDQFLNTDKYYSDVKIFEDKIISIWSDRRNGPFDVYCNIRSFANPDTTVNIVQTSSFVPESFSLHQNYPNPFNNSTQIGFDISRNNYYKLEIYNSLGQKVKEVFDKFLSAGSYKINFESGNISTGVYQYILSSPKERSVKSFVLVK
ncbi:MAG: T9SS type A sorting domain-containing protein [Ignavibacteria bacterium]|nr:T9SS type A sorting domain-containing protein [Ignavibacteria bacterium]